MALTKQQKQKIVVDLEEKIARQKAIIFVAITDLKVKDLSDLRKKLRKVNGELKVAKKTLLTLAFNLYFSSKNKILKEKELKIDIKKLKGEIALIFGFGDEILPAKTAYQFSQENKNLKILGGFFEEEFKEAEETVALAKLPSREELLVKLVGSLQSPISNFVNALGGNIKGLINVLAQAKT